MHFLIHKRHPKTDMDKQNVSELEDHKESQESLLYQFICDMSKKDSLLSASCKEKLRSIILDHELDQYLSLHKISSNDDKTSNILGLWNNKSKELSFDEKLELNNAIVNTLNNLLPTLNNELNEVCNRRLASLANERTASEQTLKRQNEISELTKEINDKLNKLEKQETTKTNILLEICDHKLKDVVNFSENSTELYSIKNKTLDVKSKIIHLQILQSMYSETNGSVKAYTEIYNDLKQGIAESQRRIKEYKSIIETDSL